MFRDRHLAAHNLIEGIPVLLLRLYFLPIDVIQIKAR
jgi:hypothetical protein